MTTPERETAISGKMAARSFEPREGCIAQPDFGCTLLECQPGYLAAKRYRGDAFAEPEEIAIGKYFRPREIPASATFDDLAGALGKLPPDVFAVRGALAQGVRDELAQGVLTLYPRRSHEHADGEATFEPRARSWIMLDVDNPRQGEEPRPWHAVPLDPADVASSVHAWHATLPDELRAARSTFFLSGSSHRKPHVRGHLLVMLAAPIDNATAESYASALGFDGSVCRTVQPIFCAAPVFDACTDPLAGRRTPIAFDGEPARLSFDATIAPAATRPLASGGALPATLPAPSEDAIALADAIHDRWLDGGRIETHAWLHLAGWLLGARWDKGEVGALLALLDADEGDDRKREEHFRVLVNARPLDGPGGARAWLAEDFATVDGIVNRKRNAWMASFGKHAAACDAPLMITAATGGAMYFIRIGETNEYRECVERTMRIVLRECGHGELLHNDKGRKLRVDDLRDVAITCNAVETDFSRSGHAVWDPENNRMLKGVTMKSVAPRFDAGVDAWLRSLASGKIDSVREWLAGTAQKHIHRCATALVLIGGAGIGKTLLATVVARMWNALEPVELSAVVSRFNASMVTSPIVRDDECRCLARGDVSSEDFRSYVQQRSRTYEPKGLERRMLHGAQRFILTANSISALRFSDVAGPDAAQAIAERLLLVAVSDSASARVALDALRCASGEIDFDRIEGHVAHLQETVAIPGGEQRFIGTDTDRESAMRAALAATIESAPELFDRIRDVLDGEATESAEPSAFARNVVFLRAGALWVRPGTFYDHGAVRKAIAPFQVKGRETVKIDGRVIRATCLDVDALRAALDLPR